MRTERKTLLDMYCDAHAAIVHLGQAGEWFGFDTIQAEIELEDLYPVIEENAEIEFDVPYEENANITLWEVD